MVPLVKTGTGGDALYPSPAAPSWGPTCMTCLPPTIVVRDFAVRSTPTGRGPYGQSSHAWRRDGERRPRQLGHIVAGICSALRSPYPASDGPRVRGASRHHATIGHSAVSARCVRPQDSALRTFADSSVTSEWVPTRKLRCVTYLGRGAHPHPAWRKAHTANFPQPIQNG